ncbi:MAG: PepSY domain-containing protein [Kordiimonas sp.]
MTKQSWHIFISKMHKWVGLILGIQLLFWTVGGIVMSWIPIEQVRGEHKIAKQSVSPIKPNDALVSINDLLTSIEGNVSSIEYKKLLGQPVAKVRLENGNTEIWDAINAVQISPISANMALQIATADYAPDSPVISVEEINETSIDYRRALPVWKITFADKENTALYVSPTEARVVSRRSSVWRFYDFFWMLHIMDYDERHNFNNPLIMATSLFATLFAISGFFLLYFRFSRRDFRFLSGKEK